EESSKDEEDDEMDVKADEEEEEEHPTPTDSVVVALTAADQAPYAEETEPFETRLDDEQTERQLLAGRLNMLFRDRRAHAYTRLLMEAKVRMSRETWTRATDASDLVHDCDFRVTEGQVTALQAQVATLQGQQGRQGLAKDFTHPEPPEEAGGSA
nr:hypothetical protein [Tanacetum cinerariifolium]